nr:phage major tail protein 2 [uncultured Mediterranean phage uvMED]
MAFFTGANGSLELEGVKIAAVQNWSFTVNVQTAEVTPLGGTDTTIIPVKRTTTGSCRILYYQNVTGTKDSTSSSSAFINKIAKAKNPPPLTGAPLEQGDNDPSGDVFSLLRLKMDDGSATGRFVEMRILITSLTVTMSVGEIFAADIQFQNNGAIKGLDL